MMNQQSAINTQQSTIIPSHKWKVVLAINLLLGLLLFFGLFTDYSWAGALPDMLYPPIVALVAIFSLRLLKRAAPTRAKGIAGRLLCLPSIFTGCIYPAILGCVIVTIPYILVIIISTAGEAINETRLQRTISPDGFQVAEVYFRGSGAYPDAEGQIIVRVKPRWLPVIERDVYTLYRSSADNDTWEHVSWVDNHTLFFVDTNELIKINRIKLSTPWMLWFTRVYFDMIRNWD